MSASFLAAAKDRSADATSSLIAPGIRINVTAAPPSSTAAGLPARQLARLARSLAFSSLAASYEQCAVRPAGTALCTTKDVGAGEVLLSLPLQFCWTLEAAKACAPLAALGTEPLDAIAPESLLALHMLIVKAERARGAIEPSPRTHHIELLTTNPVETLWDWSAADVAQLRGSKWALAVEWSKEAAREELAEYASYPPLKALLEAHAIDEAAFLWARQAVAARVMRFDVSGATEAPPVLVIAPGADLFTSGRSGESGGGEGTGDGGGFAVEGSSLVVRAPRRYAEGDDVCFSCGGGLSNGRRLLGGGLPQAANPFDVVELAFSLPLHPAAMSLYATLSDALDGAIPDAARRNPFAHEGMDLLPTEFLDEAAGGEGGEGGAGGAGGAATEMMLHVRLGAGGDGPAASAQLRRVVQFFQADLLGRAVAQQGESGSLTLESLTTPGVEGLAVKKLWAALAAMLAAYRAADADDVGADAALLAQDAAELAALDAAADAASPNAEATAARRRRFALHVTVGERRILQHAMTVLRGWQSH